MVVPDSYIKRVTSTIPFGYELSDIEGYLQPVDDQIDNLSLVVSMIKNKPYNILLNSKFFKIKVLSGNKKKS